MSSPSMYKYLSSVILM